MAMAAACEHSECTNDTLPRFLFLTLFLFLMFLLLLLLSAVRAQVCACCGCFQNGVATASLSAFAISPP
eukprot:5278018-Pyramimonas_sp.AAC.1